MLEKHLAVKIMWDLLTRIATEFHAACSQPLCIAEGETGLCEVAPCVQIPQAVVYTGGALAGFKG